MAVAAAGLAKAARAQELEPRSYSPSPVGANFVGVSYGYSIGAIVFDPSVPIDDVSAHIHGVAAGYGRTFGLLGRQALVTTVLPYAFGDISGTVQEQAKTIERSGLADFRARLAVNLYGVPALAPREFARRKHAPVLVGASVTVNAPIGEYFGDKLVNLGTNRWAIKPELGISVPWQKFFFDVYGGSWFFAENSDFYPGGKTRRQDPLSTVQAHVSYTFRPALWIAADATWYGGGASSVDGGPKSVRIDNSRYGGTLSLPVTRSQSVKLAYSRGAVVRAGDAFSTYVAGWQFVWF